MSAENRRLSKLDPADALSTSALLYVVQQPDMNPKSVKVTFEQFTNWHGGLLKAGGAMTGPITLAGDPTNPLHAAPRQYVDATAAAASDALAAAVLDLQAADEALAGAYAALEAAKLARAANLADLIDPASARGNLGLSANGSSLITAADYAAMKVLLSLGNVDNTADVAKPISTATQAALDAKQPLDDDLTAIAALAGATGILTKTAANTWALDTRAHLTSGDIGVSVQAELGFVPTSITGFTGVRTPAEIKGGLGLGNVENKSSATIRSEITSANVTSALGFTPQVAIGFTPANKAGEAFTGNISIPKLSLNTDGPFVTGGNINSGTNQLAIGTTGAAPLFFFTGNNERARVTPDGNLGVGTNNPTGRLTVGDGAYFAGGTNFTTPHLLVRTGTGATGDTARLALQTGSGGQVYLDAITEDGATAYASASIRTRSAGGVTEKLRMHSNGVVEITGGGAAAALRFPASQLPSAGSNDLDDYEEGTFTPSLRFGGDGTGIAYSVQSGRYTKIGRQVTVEVCLILTSKGAAVGNAQVFGLPFAAIAALPSGIGAVVTNQMTGVNGPACGSLQGSTAMGLYQNNTGSYSQTTNANFGNASELYLTLTYTTA